MTARIVLSQHKRGEELSVPGLLLSQVSMRSGSWTTSQCPILAASVAPTRLKTRLPPVQLTQQWVAPLILFDSMEQHESAGVEFEHRETLDEQRGRRERRLYWATRAPEALLAHDDWADLQSIGMVISERTINDHTTREVRYYISSLENDVAEFSRAVRANWSIENSLHWRLDVVFREDESRMRIGHSARAFTLFRKVAINLLNQENSRKQSLRSKRKQAARNTDYLLKVLTSV